MTTYNRSNAYRDTNVLSSSQEGLVPVLYEHLLVNLKRGSMHIRKGDIEGKFDSLARASDIVSELLAALDPEAGGQIASHLAGLYAFWLKEIATAGRELDPQRVQRVADMVASLLEAWQEVARGSESGGVVPTGQEAT